MKCESQPEMTNRHNNIMVSRFITESNRLTLWKTMSARIRGAETELEELGEETDEYTKTTSKLRDLVQSLTGFDIMIDEDTFKDVYEIILGIGKEWDNLTDAEQASLGEALAGEIYCLKNMETYFYRTHLIARTA